MVSGISHFWKTSRIRFWASSWSAAEPPGRSHQVNTYFISQAPFPSSHRSGCAHNSKLGRMRASSKRVTFGPFAANFGEGPKGEVRRNLIPRTRVNKGKKVDRSCLAQPITLAVGLPLPRSRRLADRQPLPAASPRATHRRWRTDERSPSCPTQGVLRARWARLRCAGSILPWSHVVLEWLRDRDRISASTARNRLPYGGPAGRA